jgi:hypothetical protein
MESSLPSSVSLPPSFSLTRKQKRIRDWTYCLESEFSAPSSGAPANSEHEAVRIRFTESLRDYKNLIARCWENDSMGEKEAAEIEDLERRLEQLAEDARLLG